MRKIRQIISFCSPRARRRNAASGLFLRASDTEKVEIIRKAAERANDDQAVVLRKAAKLSSKMAK